MTIFFFFFFSFFFFLGGGGCPVLIVFGNILSNFSGRRGRGG